MANTYRNWHKHRTNTKQSALSNTFPFRMNKRGEGMEIEFTNDENKTVSFSLDEESTKLFKMNFDRFILGKETTREQYGLSKI